MKNLWILTEELPKKEVIKTIFTIFAREQGITNFSFGDIKIVPIIKDGRFTFTYQVQGINSPLLSQILIKIISGQSSVVDYLIFYQKNRPQHPYERPLFVIEETKTDDSESRNTGIFQRCTKFVFIDLFYKNVKKFMLYSLEIAQKEQPTPTNIFGSKLLATYGVEIIGKKQNKEQITPFKSINELIELKNSMRRPPQGNVPILISQSNEEIKISGRLVKSGSLSHDPNIGALSMIAAVLRKLGWKGKIVITEHGLTQANLPKPTRKRINKFIKICLALDIELENITLLPDWRNLILDNDEYWSFEDNGEKIATIFLHLVIDNFTQGYSIFNNHAGCEKSYFRRKDDSVTPLKKYSDRTAYKKGDKTAIVYIPDLVLVDIKNLEIINIEGKTYSNMDRGISELDNYDFIENEYIKPSYNDHNIIRTVVLYGGYETNNNNLHQDIGFLLSWSGEMILGPQAPKLFKEGICNLLDYWNIQPPKL